MLVMLFVKSFMFLLMGMFTLYSGFDNKIYFEFYLKKCFSECNGGMFNFVCYDDCGELNYDNIVYKKVDSFMLRKINIG
jgi:hypothetical protein